MTGARQVGKTYLVRAFGAERYESFVELNLILDAQAAAAFDGPSSPKDILMRLSLLADAPLVPGKTLVFIDEVQERPEVVTAIKGLVDEGSYDYVLSGSLLGLELKDLRSAPVGYLSELMMHPSTSKSSAGPPTSARRCSAPSPTASRACSPSTTSSISIC